MLWYDLHRHKRGWERLLDNEAVHLLLSTYYEDGFLACGGGGDFVLPNTSTQLKAFEHIATFTHMYRVGLYTCFNVFWWVLLFSWQVFQCFFIVVYCRVGFPLLLWFPNPQFHFRGINPCTWTWADQFIAWWKPLPLATQTVQRSKHQYDSRLIDCNLQDLSRLVVKAFSPEMLQEDNRLLWSELGDGEREREIRSCAEIWWDSRDDSVDKVR